MTKRICLLFLCCLAVVYLAAKSSHLSPPAIDPSVSEVSPKMQRIHREELQSYEMEASANQSQPEEDSGSDLEDSARMSEEEGRPRWVKRRKKIDIDYEKLNKDGFGFDLEGKGRLDVLPVLDTQRLSNAPEGGTDFVGLVQDQEKNDIGNAVLFALEGGEPVYSGRIVLDSGELFTLNYDQDGNLVLDQIDPAKLPGNHSVVKVRFKDKESGLESFVGNSGQIAPSPDKNPSHTASPSSVIEVDLLVAYTSSAMESVGGREQILALIENAVQATNLSYSNSEVGITLRLVHSAEVSYIETDDFVTDLQRLQKVDDGFLDEIHNLRETYQADLVSLFVDSMDNCGLGYVMEEIRPEYRHFMFNVVSAHCAVTTLALAHEIGHNFGAGHGSESFDLGIFPYSHGHAFGRFQTIMSTRPEAIRVSFFSNPDVVVSGFPSGVPGGEPGEADVARSFNETVSFIAEFFGE